MFTCEYDTTQVPVDNQAIKDYANTLFPSHKEVKEAIHDSLFKEFVEKEGDNIHAKMCQLTNNCLVFEHQGKLFFGIVMHPGLNGEHWYYGEVKVTSEPIGKLGRYNERLWTVPKLLKGTKTSSDIMMENGYHPAGYGNPYEETSDEHYYYFKSSNSCD